MKFPLIILLIRYHLISASTSLQHQRRYIDMYVCMYIYCWTNKKWKVNNYYDAEGALLCRQKGAWYLLLESPFQQTCSCSSLRVLMNQPFASTSLQLVRCKSSDSDIPPSFRLLVGKVSPRFVIWRLDAEVI